MSICLPCGYRYIKFAKLVTIILQVTSGLMLVTMDLIEFGRGMDAGLLPASTCGIVSNNVQIHAIWSSDPTLFEVDYVPLVAIPFKTACREHYFKMQQLAVIL